MKLFHKDRFLTVGAAALPGGFRAVAIHPSSEVDLVDLGGGVQLGVGSVVPLTGQAQNVAPVRYFLDSLGILGSHAPLDGNRIIGEKLVLALYEGCDPLIPPGPRVPAFCSYRIKQAVLPTTEADAVLAFRVPMQGRSRCVVSLKRDDPTVDLHVLIFGRRAGLRAHRLAGSAIGVEVVAAAAEETWWNGAGAAPTVFSGATFVHRQVNIENERFDELLVYAYGDAGTDDSSLTAEAYGEGANL